jgi:hypothetical protein
MHKMTLISRWKVILGTAVCAAMLAGCGNGSNTVNDPPASTDISANVGALIAYMERLIGTDGNSDGVDVNAVTLVQDESSEPTAISF